jgi:hypothetical protein
VKETAGERQGEQDALVKIAKQVPTLQKVQAQKTVGAQLCWQWHDQDGKFVHRYTQSENLADTNKPCLGNS